MGLIRTVQKIKKVKHKNNKKSWEELIRLLSLHKFAVNNLVTMLTMEHKISKPTAEQGSPNNFEPK
jgi:hypothetical protein